MKPEYPHKHQQLSNINVDLHSYDGGGFGRCVCIDNVTLTYEGGEKISFNCKHSMEKVSEQLKDIADVVYGLGETLAGPSLFEKGKGKR